MNAKDLVCEMIRQRDAGRRVKTMRSLKRQIMEALGLSDTCKSKAS